MPKLQVTRPDGTEEEHQLSGEATVGREAGVELRLDDPGVSRRHARLFVERGTVHVEDLGSANGIFIDGEKVEGTAPLPPGAALQVGDFEIRVAEPGTMRRPTPGRPGAASSARLPPGSLSSSRPPPGSLSTSRRPPPGALSSGRSGPGGRSPPRGASPVKGAPVARKPAASLKGTSGPWAGQVFELSGSKVIVGRVEPADIVLDDDSVSREHAELVEAPRGGYLLRDLGSANGTFVNRQRIEERALKSGDIVKFGVLDFSYQGPSAKTPVSAGDAATKRKKLLLAGGAVVVVLIALAVAKPIIFPTPVETGLKSPVDDSAAGKVKQREEQVTRAKIRMRTFLDSGEWDKAIAEAEKVLELDPISVDARKAQGVAKREQGFQKIYEEGKTKQSLGQDEDALQRYFQIPQDSEYYKRTRGEVQKIALDQLSVKYKGDCVGYYNANNFERAVQVCGRYLDFVCHSKTDVEILKKLRAAEGQLKKKKETEPWQCPADLLHWFRSESFFDKEKQAAIREMYGGEGALSTAIERYGLEGKAPIAIDELKRMRADHRNSKYFDVLDKTIERMQIVAGKSSDGQTLFLQEKIKEADAQWALCIEKDKEIMPPGFESVIIKSIRQHLGDGWYREGKKYSDRSQYKPAFEAWAKGAAANPSNMNIRTALNRLEREADSILASAPSCLQIKEALAITQPESAAHKKALEAFKERGCK